jgi:LmbE family N-acetylglucosaminyl deacetylase
MKGLGLARRGEQLSILCLGAHSDDIEIGAGGTILTLIASGVKLDVHWCVLSGGGQRSAEARASAEAFLQGSNSSQVEVADFEDSYFPVHSRSIKHWLIEVRSRINPDVVLTHARFDAHQDHREVNQLTWNVFRDHLVLEYEIPKWDGDLGQPNAYVPLTAAVLERKVELLHQHFGTQRSKDWFDRDTFAGLARLRGMECRAPEHFAEAFTVRKAKLF